MLSQQYGYIIIFLLDHRPSRHLHYGRYNYVGQHCRPQNSRQLWVVELSGAKNGEGTVLLQVGRGPSSPDGFRVMLKWCIIHTYIFFHSSYVHNKLLTHWWYITYLFFWQMLQVSGEGAPRIIICHLIRHWASKLVFLDLMICIYYSILLASVFVLVGFCVCFCCFQCLYLTAPVFVLHFESFSVCIWLPRCL